MVEEDFFCSGCREGLSQEYSALRSYSLKNSYRVHRYHSDVRDFLDAVENRCFVCTTVWKSLSAESHATYLQGNTSTQKAWGGIRLDMCLWGDQPPSLRARVMIRDIGGRGSDINSFKIVPFTGISSQQLLVTACNAFILHFSCWVCLHLLTERQ